MSYCIDCFHVVGDSCKLQYDHCISKLIGCFQGFSGVHKVFKDNEQLISLEIIMFRPVACSSASILTLAVS